MGSVNQSTPYGKPMREHFLFEKNYTNLNHGSFGTYPQPVQRALRHFQDQAEARPDHFMRYQYQDLLLAARTAAAALLHVPVSTCVFVQNATLGINTVLRNLVYAPGDVIVYFDTIYGACEKTIESIVETTRPEVGVRKVGGFEFPGEWGEVVVERFREVVSGLEAEGLRARVAVFETICAVPGVRFPFERVTEECRRLGVLSCVDAAHGLGQIPLDLAGLDPDFWVSNCHKWLFTPRGSALFYVPTRNQPLIRTSYPTSHGFEPLPRTKNQAPIPSPLPPPSSPDSTTPFTTLFQYTATADNTPYYTVPTALSFRAHVCPGGETGIYTYLRTLARRGGDLVAARLGTEVMDSPGHELRDCAFANVRLPLPTTTTTTTTTTTGGSGRGDDDDDDDKDEGEGKENNGGDGAIPATALGGVVNHMQKTLLDEFNTFIAIYVYKGRVWARLSAQVYLDEGDFAWAGEVLGVLCGRVRGGEGWREGEGESQGKSQGKGEEGEGQKDIEARLSSSLDLVDEKQ